MKICAIICEFNPFHNGHRYLIDRAKAITGCEAVLCVMSGSFTQRGDICVLSKYARAEHAILGGADMVIELPPFFAVAPAEVFALGGVKTAKGVGGVTSLIFGSENPTDFSSLAERAVREDEDFKNRLAENLKDGKGYAAAYSLALGQDAPLSPNDILAVEYAKANIKLGANLSLFPVRREGGDYNDGNLAGNFASAKAIRANREDERIYCFAPKKVCDALRKTKDNGKRFEDFVRDMLFITDKEKLKRIYGCTEGLENRLKKYCLGRSYEEILNACCGKRYTKTRIKRILCANALNLFADETEDFLKSQLSVNVLAVKKERADELLPLVAKNENLTPAAEQCRKLTQYSYELWRHLSYPDGEDDPLGKMKLV